MAHTEIVNIDLTPAHLESISPNTMSEKETQEMVQRIRAALTECESSIKHLINLKYRNPAMFKHVNGEARLKSLSYGVNQYETFLTAIENGYRP